MQSEYIIHALAQKVIDTIYDEWHHDGHIGVERSDAFSFTVDEKRYEVCLHELNGRCEEVLHE